jgi:hypothetical protein
MSFGLSDRGEELQYTASFVGLDLDLILYLDSTDIDGDGAVEGDDLTDADGTGAITTQPNGFSPKTVTIQSGDIGQFSGDFGFELSANINVDGVTDKIDGVVLAESGTTNIIARTEIQSPEPGPFQSLSGLKTIEIIPRVTTD